jgi:GNAT superfamily N-acetyltransferase
VGNLSLKWGGNLGCVFKALTPADAGRIMDLQQAYQKVYPKAQVVQADVYLSRNMGSGENLICAFDESNIMQGYAALSANPALSANAPHIIWGIIRVRPDLSAPDSLEDSLFDQAVSKAREIVRGQPGHEIQLNFQHHSTEVPIIEFLKSKGCVHSDTFVRMGYGLSRDIVLPPLTPGIKIGYSRMDDPEEQKAYVAAGNEAFPAVAMTLKTWRYLLNSIIFPHGNVVVAYDGKQLVGSATVFWNEAVNKQYSIDMGTTEYVFVRDGWRRRGIAEYMVAMGLRFLKENGLKFAYLDTHASNRNAINLYTKMGYNILDEIPVYTRVLTGG